QSSELMRGSLASPFRDSSARKTAQCAVFSKNGAADPWKGAPQGRRGRLPDESELLFLRIAIICIFVPTIKYFYSVHAQECGIMKMGN
ncbi:MAG: hypothetical protein ACSW8J_04020, partial [bacterium]